MHDVNVEHTYPYRILLLEVATALIQPSSTGKYIPANYHLHPSCWMIFSNNDKNISSAWIPLAA